MEINCDYVFDKFITVLNFWSFSVMESSSTSPMLRQILQENQKTLMFLHISILLFNLIFCCKIIFA